MAARIFYSSVAICFLMSFFTMLGDITANTLNNTLILSRLGADAFGYMTFCKAISVVAASAIIASIAGRVPKTRLLLGFLAVIAGMGAAASMLLNTHFGVAISLMVAAEGALLVGFNFLIWPIYNDVFPILYRRKAFPLISAGYGFAGVAAGLLVAESLKHFGIVGLAGTFTGLVVATLALVLCLRRIPHPQAAGTQATADGSPSPITFFERMRSLRKVFSGAPFLRWLFAFNILVWIAYRLIDFRFNIELQALSGTEEKFGTYLGYCYSGINIAIVLYQVVFAKGVLTHIGLTRLLMLYPALMVGVSTAGLATGNSMFTFANRALSELMLYSVILSAIALVYNIVDSGLRATAQALIEGMGASLGTIIGSGLLVLIGTLFITSVHADLSNALILAANLGSLFAALKVGRTFIDKAIENLNSQDQALTLNSIQALQERGRRDAIARLLKVAFNESGSFDPTTVNLAVRTLSQLRHRLMPNLFLKLLHDDDPRKMLFAFNMLQDFYLNEVRTNFILRHKVLVAVEEVIVRTGTGDDSMNIVHKAATRLYFKVAYPETLSKFLEKVLESDQERLIANTIEGLTFLENKYAYLFIERFLNHPNNRVRSTAIVELWGLREEKEALELALKKMLADTELANRVSAIWALGRIRSLELSPLLLGYIPSTVPRELRIHAIYSLLRFPHRTLQRKLGLSTKQIEQLYRDLLLEMTNRSEQARARRSLHFAVNIDPSHVARLDHCVIDMALCIDSLTFLRNNLFELGEAAIPLLEFTGRFVGATSHEQENIANSESVAVA